MILKLFNEKKFNFKKPEIDRRDVGKGLKERIIPLDAGCSILLQIRDVDMAKFVTFLDGLDELCYINLGSKTDSMSYHINDDSDREITREMFFEYLQQQKSKLPEWFIWNML